MKDLFEERQARIYLVMLIVGILFLSVIQVIFFPMELEEGLSFSVELDANDGTTLSDIYRNISKKDITIENTTANVTTSQGGCSGGSCQLETRSVPQLIISSEDWEDIDEMKAWVDSNGTIRFEGRYPLILSSFLDVGSVQRENHGCKEKVVSILDGLGFDVGDEDVIVSPVGIFDMLPLCLSVLVFIMFVSSVSLLFFTLDKEDTDYSKEKVIGLLPIAGVFFIVIYMLNSSGYSNYACSMYLIMPLSLIIVGMFLFVPDDFNYVKLLIAFLIIFIMFLIILIMTNPLSSCFICFFVVLIAIIVTILSFILMKTMKEEGKL
ncbi:MAG: hypothetical protein ACQESD_01175 [Thermoplasmatota archaeon]